jgi:putative ABC transport system permease protein
MKFLEIARTTWSNLKGKKTRTTLTVSGIAVGIGAIVFLVSLGYGLQEFSIKRISSINSLSTLDVSQGKTANFRLDEPTVAKIKAIPGVAETSPVLSLAGKISYLGQKTDIVATAVEEKFFTYEDMRLQRGGFFSDNDQKVVISSALQQSLGLEPSTSLDKEVILSLSSKAKDGSTTVKDIKLKISGIIQDSTASFAYFPIATVQDQITADTVFSGLKVKAKSNNDIANVRQEIEALGLGVTSIGDTISQINSVFKIVRIFLGALGGIALLVAAIGMFNTMTIALLERTRDIGIMKAIGVDNRDIYWMFLAEAIIISGLGGALGGILGLLLSEGINAIVNGLAKLVGADSVILFRTPLYFVAIVIIFALIVGVSTGIYPSRRAAKINPLDALRYE